MLAAFRSGSALLRAVSARLAGLGAAAAQRLRALRPARSTAEGLADVYRSLVEYTADPVYMLDLADGFRMVFANQACCRHFGVSHEALYQWRLPDWDPAFKAEDLDGLWQGIRERKFFTLETWHQLSDGRMVPVEVSINHLVYAGREYAAGYFRDISERLEVDRMKSDFLSTAAHELRTPLASVYGFAELLLSDEGHDAEAQREMLEIIFRQSKLISALVNELLDLARIEARQGKDFVFEQVDLCALVRETVSADPEGSQWRWPVRVAVPETPVWVRGDANKLRQAVGNVLSNAYKYSPDGGEIQVSLRHEPGEVVVEIQDHGLGMTPDQAARVCERFYRADRSGRIPGTGLGMSIVKEIVTLHGGHLRIDSQPGAGTAVAIHLPDGLGQQS